MKPLSSQIQEQSSRRRSQRILIDIPVMISAPEIDGRSVLEDTHTLVVSTHGALVILSFLPSIGQLLTLKNSKSGEEQSCRVVMVNPSPSDKFQVGIEFIKPAPRFWHIEFPPPDWSPQHPEARGYRPRTADGNRLGKKG